MAPSPTSWPLGAETTDTPRFLPPGAAHPARAAVRGKSWIRPAPLLVAGVIAVWPLVRIVHRPMSPPRPLVKAFVTILTVVALGWLAGVVLWLIEQQW